jgi:hypothetical protein
MNASVGTTRVTHLFPSSHTVFPKSKNTVPNGILELEA